MGGGGATGTDGASAEAVPTGSKSREATPAHCSPEDDGGWVNVDDAEPTPQDSRGGETTETQASDGPEAARALEAILDPERVGAARQLPRAVVTTNSGGHIPAGWQTPVITTANTDKTYWSGTPAGGGSTGFDFGASTTDPRLPPTGASCDDTSSDDSASEHPWNRERAAFEATRQNSTLRSSHAWQDNTLRSSHAWQDSTLRSSHKWQDSTLRSSHKWQDSNVAIGSTMAQHMQNEIDEAAVAPAVTTDMDESPPMTRKHLIESDPGSRGEQDGAVFRSALPTLPWLQPSLRTRVRDDAVVFDQQVAGKDFSFRPSKIVAVPVVYLLVLLCVTTAMLLASGATAAATAAAPAGPAAAANYSSTAPAPGGIPGDTAAGGLLVQYDLDASGSLDALELQAMTKNLIHFESQQDKVEFEALVEAVASPRVDSNGEDRSAPAPREQSGAGRVDVTRGAVPHHATAATENATSGADSSRGTGDRDAEALAAVLSRVDALQAQVDGLRRAEAPATAGAPEVSREAAAPRPEQPHRQADGVERAAASQCLAAEGEYCSRGAAGCAACLQARSAPLMAAGCHADDFADFCAPSAAAEGWCYQAATADYPDCAGYGALGYACRGGTCAAMDPLGDPDACAVRAPRGHAVDARTGTCRRGPPAAEHGGQERLSEEARRLDGDGILTPNLGAWTQRGRFTPHDGPHAAGGAAADPPPRPGGAPRSAACGDGPAALPCGEGLACAQGVCVHTIGLSRQLSEQAEIDEARRLYRWSGAGCKEGYSDETLTRCLEDYLDPDSKESYLSELARSRLMPDGWRHASDAEAEPRGDARGGKHDGGASDEQLWWEDMSTALGAAAADVKAAASGAMVHAADKVAEGCQSVQESEFAAKASGAAASAKAAASDAAARAADQLAEARRQIQHSDFAAKASDAAGRAGDALAETVRTIWAGKHNGFAETSTENTPPNFAGKVDPSEQKPFADEARAAPDDVNLHDGARPAQPQEPDIAGFAGYTKGVFGEVRRSMEVLKQAFDEHHMVWTAKRGRELAGQRVEVLGADRADGSVKVRLVDADDGPRGARIRWLPRDAIAVDSSDHDRAGDQPRDAGRQRHSTSSTYRRDRARQHPLEGNTVRSKNKRR